MSTEPVSPLAIERIPAVSETPIDGGVVETMVTTSDADWLTTPGALAVTVSTYVAGPIAASAAHVSALVDTAEGMTLGSSAAVTYAGAPVTVRVTAPS